MENKDLKIVMVEDNEFFAQMISEALATQYGYQVQLFYSGEAMLKVPELEPDIVLLDFQLNSNDLQNMNGDKVLEQLKLRNPKTRVVLISSQSDLERAIELLKHGACNYICKDMDSIKNIALTLEHLKGLIELQTELGYYKTKSGNEKKRMAWLLSILGVSLLASYYLG